MKFITPIIFIQESVCGNGLGDMVITQQERKAIGNKVSVGNKEFYEAHALGLKPEIKIEVRTIEYKGEQKLKLGNKTYAVIKTYDRQEGVTELTLTSLVNNVASISKRNALNGLTKVDKSTDSDGECHYVSP